RQRDPDHDHIDPGMFLPPASWRHFVSHLCSFDSFRRCFKGPGDDQGNGKTNGYKGNDSTHNPVRYFEERKDLGRDLDQQPTDNGIGDRTLVGMMAVELGEEIAVAHFSWSQAKPIVRNDACERGAWRRFQSSVSAHKAGKPTTCCRGPLSIHSTA